ncbi:glycine-rich protein [Bdellovibrio sp. ArHS]|uniref:beta strand repeat-containing protein n=1 Tax=Bdellovibrio sp. ArHS TaxID=1569284 RepID=UPI0025C67F3F|nr:glycine-rich protein [Bdellovibrio sp. ArHS]
MSLFIFTACGNVELDLMSSRLKNSLKVAEDQRNELIIGDTHQLSPTGGSGDYVFTIVSGGGTIDPQTGLFTAPTTPGITRIEIKDGSGHSIIFEVRVQPPLSFAVSAPVIAENNVFDFDASGGVAPLTYSLVSGGGSIDPQTGLYNPNGYVGAAIIKTTDAVGNVLINTITVQPALKITPATHTLWTLTTQTFTGVDGVPPYTYIVLTGLGSIGLTDGLYQAPATAGSAILVVADSLGNTSQATVTIDLALSLTSDSLIIAQNNSTTVTGQGGAPPYTYAKVSGPGSIDASTGVYTPGASGTGVLQVTDSLGNTATLNVTVNPVLQISPAAKTLALGNETTFTASGGVSPYIFSANAGSIGALSGEYIAPGTSGSALVTVTDSLGNTSSATVTINPALQITPASKILAVNNTFAFTASNGVPPYSYTVNNGAINASTGSYSAPAASGVATVTVADSAGNVATAAVTINASLSLSASLSVIAANNTTTISATGGVPPYVYSKDSGPGSVNSSSGIYTPGSSGSGVLKVTDSLANTASVTVTVNAALAISPSTATVNINTTRTLSASGGVSPYTFSLISGGGSIDASSGLYSAPATTGTAAARVTDALGNTSDSTLNITDCVPGKIVFTYTGAAQTFTQPTGCTKVTIKAWGAGGGGGWFGAFGTIGSAGGGGGYATGDFALEPGGQLGIYVGGAAASGVRGWNGGGLGGKFDSTMYSGSGGGASDVRHQGAALANRILVAGGGGGGSYGGLIMSPGGGGGGAGGGTSGAYPDVYPATGGSQSAGGLGESCAPGACPTQGNPGTWGVGGDSTTWSSLTAYPGGGGGYYGGGGGYMLSAGGGSSYVGGVANGSTTAASGSTPGNSGDADRSNAGLGGAMNAVGTSGRIVIYYGF